MGEGWQEKLNRQTAPLSFSRARPAERPPDPAPSDKTLHSLPPPPAPHPDTGTFSHPHGWKTLDLLSILFKISTLDHLFCFRNQTSNKYYLALFFFFLQK